jgi:hypothetical protein
MTLLLGCCCNEVPIREPTQDFGPNGVHKSSIEIAVDQRQHIGKARQIGADFFPFSSEWHPTSKQTSKDLFEGLILRLRLTIRNGDDDYGYRYGYRHHRQTNGCPPGWTVQGGNCAPYKGPGGVGWNTPNGCPPGYTVQGGNCAPYRYGR